MTSCDLLIIGSGPAGYTAGIYAGRAELAPLILAGATPGGQLTMTTEVENWPGEPNGIYGTKLMDNLRNQAVKFGAQIVMETATEVDFSTRPFIIKTDRGEYRARAVIIATGASAKWLGVPGEDRLRGYGVSACATCDGFFFKNKKVMVVGGGDVALEEANVLSKFASEVILAVRRDEFRASKAMQKKIIKNPKIKIMWNSEVRELIGEDKLESAKIFNNKTNEESIVAIDGLFAAVGHKPNTDLFVGKLDLDEQGYIKHANNSTKTSVDGIFAAGDVIDPNFRQAIVAAGSGCMAALEAERFLSD